VRTAPLGLRTAASDFEESVVVEPPSGRTRVLPERVVVRGRLEEIVVSRELKQVELGIRNGGEVPVRLKPAHGDVTLRGPQRILESFRATSENFFVDVEGVEKGTHRLPVETQLPEGVRVSRLEPEVVTVEIGPEPPATRR
jgi:hypothetical protein